MLPAPNSLQVVVTSAVVFGGDLEREVVVVVRNELLFDLVARHRVKVVDDFDAFALGARVQEVDAGRDLAARRPELESHAGGKDQLFAADHLRGVGEQHVRDDALGDLAGVGEQVALTGIASGVGARPERRWMRHAEHVAVVQPAGRVEPSRVHVLVLEAPGKPRRCTVDCSSPGPRSCGGTIRRKPLRGGSGRLSSVGISP